MRPTHLLSDTVVASCQSVIQEMLEPNQKKYTKATAKHSCKPEVLKQFYSKPEVQRSKKTVTGATTFARMNVSYETFAKTDKETFQNERFVRDIRKN